ncbi:hypothetical protein OG709_16055 [Streptomyces sp. NBC_01267]|uniref:DUF7224 domain-containing protein n=1 Tax=unclassified Streptomyces TaxID=2593676 RepID=UPI002023D3AF|nr:MULTISPECIES: hypothetical protein [unclassified Streptomyces]WSC21541.1 hypothetical protein OIE60_18700 [Streptomyces sp. NBC_01766]
MRITTLLRSGPAAWIALVLVPVLFWFGAQNTDSVIAYWESATTQSLIVLGFVSAACGACAAWEAARIHRAGVDGWAPARNPLQVAWMHLAPVAALGLLGLLASLAAISTSAVGAPGFPSLGVLVTAYAVVVSHIALGWLIGPLMPRMLGAASMLIFGYLWGFWPAALGEVPWLRHLNGQGIVECCGLDQTASVRSMAATITFSAGLLAAALLATAFGTKQRRHRIYVISAVVLGTAGAVGLAVPLEFQGTQARNQNLLKCAGTQPVVCVWPEQYDRRKEITRWAKDAGQRVHSVGVSTAARIEFGQPQPSEASIRATVATSVLPTAPPACAMRPRAEYPGDAAHTAIYAWLALTGGETKADLVQHWVSDAVDLAEEVRKLRPAQQHAWYERNMRSVLDCAVDPDLNPASFRGPLAGNS